MTKSNIVKGALNKIEPHVKRTTQLNLDIAIKVHEKMTEKGMSEKGLAEKIKEDPEKIKKLLTGTVFFDTFIIAKIETALNIRLIQVNK